MLYDAKKVLELIGPDDLVIDIGGAYEVFPRANAVVDMVPYEQRSPGQLRDLPEQFTADTWYVGDICDDAVWQQFSDKQFDFVICSHVLEDIRDPLFVCRQMLRIGKSGYIEVPSKFRECCRADPNSLVTGWEHHRWLIEYVDDTLAFTPKLPYFGYFDYLGDLRRSELHDFGRQFLSLHWKGSFNYAERVTKGSPAETENMFLYVDQCLQSAPVPLHVADHVPFKGKTLEWYGDFRLPIEDVLSLEQIARQYEQRCAARPSVAGANRQRFAGRLAGKMYSLARRIKRRLT